MKLLPERRPGVVVVPNGVVTPGYLVMIVISKVFDLENGYPK